MLQQLVIPFYNSLYVAGRLLSLSLVNNDWFSPDTFCLRMTAGAINKSLHGEEEVWASQRTERETCSSSNGNTLLTRRPEIPRSYESLND